MPAWSRRAKHLDKARERSAAVNKLSAETRALQASLPPLVAEGPVHLQAAVQRPVMPRTAALVAKDAWRDCVDFFDKLPLVLEPGAIDDPESDYGGLRHEFGFTDDTPRINDAGQRLGILFRGLPACKKKTQSKEYIPANSRGFMPVLHHLLLSMANVQFPSYWARFSAICGADTKMHVDNNTRGSHPNASRMLDPGGGILLYKWIHFRCSFIHFKGQQVVPWALNSEQFHFMVWDAKGQATIKDAPAADFWALAQGPTNPTVGLFNCCLIDIKKGAAKGCPLVGLTGAPLPKSAAALTAYTFAELYEQAASSAAAPDPEEAKWEVHGYDVPEAEVAKQVPVGDSVKMPTSTGWAVWFGWRHAHCYLGDPMVRRYHIFGCPMRNVPMGQVRKKKQCTQQSVEEGSEDEEWLVPSLYKVMHHFLRERKGGPPPPPPPKKRQRKQPQPSQSSPGADVVLSPYEQERQANIEENQRVLRSLGLLE